jgi:HEAT repeat protein
MIALMALLACGPSSDDVTRNLSSPNPVVREDTAKIARNVDSAEVEAALIGALGDEEMRVRLHAVESLAELDATTAVPGLVERLESEVDPAVRRAIVDALGRLGDAAAVPALIAALEARYETPPLDVIWALGALEDDRALNVLSRLRANDDMYVRWNVNQALRKLRPASNSEG